MSSTAPAKWPWTRSPSFSKFRTSEIFFGSTRTETRAPTSSLKLAVNEPKLTDWSFARASGAGRNTLKIHPIAMNRSTTVASNRVLLFWIDSSSQFSKWANQGGCTRIRAKGDSCQRGWSRIYSHADGRADPGQGRPQPGADFCGRADASDGQASSGRSRASSASKKNKRNCARDLTGTANFEFSQRISPSPDRLSRDWTPQSNISPMHTALHGCFFLVAESAAAAVLRCFASRSIALSMPMTARTVRGWHRGQLFRLERRRRSLRSR